jgi:anti-sigma-K factor RskA
LHCDDDDLSLIALGEPASGSDEAHLRECGRCQSRLDQLAAVASTGRTVTAEDRPVSPPPAVWEAISRELALDAPANVTSISEARAARRPRTWLVAAAAAVVGLLVGGVVTAGLVGSSSSQDVVAEAALGPIDNSGFAGVATVERGSDGAVLTVNVPGLPEVSDGYYEVWMATPDTATMVAVGTYSPGQDAHFPLPTGMDVASFPVVDVSVEHFDGNAGHSATSVVRGQLPA